MQALGSLNACLASFIEVSSREMGKSQTDIKKSNMFLFHVYNMTARVVEF
jgi:hypothetical protein